MRRVNESGKPILEDGEIGFQYGHPKSSNILIFMVLSLSWITGNMNLKMKLMTKMHMLLDH
jgi:hypothetical protein